MLAIFTQLFLGHNVNIELIEQANSEIAEYNPVAAGLAELKRKYANVAVDVATPKALDEAKRVRAEIREPRYETEKIRKMLKAPALAHAKLIDTEAARITAELLAIESPWDEAIKAEEARKEAEKAAREAAERARITAIHARISSIKEFVALAAECRTSARIQALQDKLCAFDMEGFDEFSMEAATAQEESVKRVDAILTAKLEEEAEREAAKQAQAAKAEKLKAERDAFAAQQAAAKAEAEAQAAAFAAQQAAAQAELDKQRAAIAAEQEAARKIVAEHQAKVEAAAKAEREAAAKLAAEQAAAQQAAEFEAQRAAMAQAIETPPAQAEQALDAIKDEPIWLDKEPSNPEPTGPSDHEIILTAVSAICNNLNLSQEQALARLAAVEAWTL